VVSATDGTTARTPEFQIAGTVGTIDGAALITTFNTNGSGVGNGSNLSFAKSRGSFGTVGTAVGTTDALGAIVAYGDDGTNMYSPAAAIYFEVDGTVGTNVMPGKIEFYTTPAGSETLTKRMTIDKAGVLTLTGVAGSLASGVTKAYCTAIGDGTLQSNSFNTTSVAKTATGKYTVTWGTNFANTNYVVQITTEDTASEVTGVVATATVGYATIEIIEDQNWIDRPFHILAIGDQ
jgi:hypothetical protein